MKTKRRLLSLLLCGTMLFSLCVQPIFAETGTQTCEKAEILQDEESVVLNVQIMIDELPGVEKVKAMSLDGQRKAYDRLQVVYDAYEALSDGEQEQIEGTEILEELFHWFNSQIETTAETASGDFGDEFHWALDDDGTLTITGTGEMPDYRYDLDAPWKGHKEKIIKVIIGTDVTTIGNYTFNGCTSLVSIELPASVTTIGNYAFQNCSSLEITELPAGMTSIEDCTFQGCTSLKLTELPAGVTTIGNYAFQDCSSLVLTELPAGVTTIGNYAFKGCSSLALTELPEGVTKMGYLAFRDCSSLALIKLPDGLTSIEKSVFENCSSLALTELPAGLTTIEEFAFKGCSSLALEKLPDNLITIEDNAFWDCSSLALTELPDTLATIGGYAFISCSKLALTELPASVTTIGDYAFWNCSSLTEIIFTSNQAPKLGSSVFGNCAALEKIYIPDGAAGYDVLDWSGNENKVETITAPSFTSHPKSVDVAVGQTTIFTVTANGSPAPTYQWQVSKNGSNWENIFGATDSSYTTEATNKNMDGWIYRCVAANREGNTISNEATLTVKLIDAGVQSVFVDGTDGTINGTTITVVLPFGKTSPTESSKISITPAAGATVSALATTDNGATWTFTVTAEDGITTASYTIMVSNAPNPAEENIVDVGEVKSTIQNTGWIVEQSIANTEAEVKSWIENQLNDMNLNGVSCVVSITGFTVATAGNSVNTDGTDGRFTFTVSLSKGAESTLATDTTTEISGTITAMPYQTQSYMISVNSSPTEGGMISGGGTYTENDFVTVTASAKDGYHFVKWTENGSEVSTNASYIFTITGNRTLVAVFERDSTLPQPVQYSVTIQTNDNGIASASPTSAVQGTEIILTATPDSGYYFKEWQVISGGVTISNNRFIMPAANVAVKAVFEQEITSPQPIQYNVTINDSYAAANGTGSYEAGATVSIHAGSRSNYRFNGWTSSDGIRFANAGNTSTTFIMPDKAVTVMATWTYIGENSDSEEEDDSSSDDSDSSDDSFTMAEHPDKTKPEIPVISQTKQIIPDADGNAVVDNDTVLSAIQTAKDEAKKNGTLTNGVAISVPVTAKADQTSFSVTIKTQAIHTIVREEVKRLEIVVEGMIVGGMDADLLKWLDTTSGNGDIIFRMKQTEALESAQSAIGTRPVYDLSMVYLSNGKETPILDFGGHTFTIRLLYTPAKEEQTGNLYAVYVDNAGKVEWLTKSSYDPNLGAVVFETGHFSVYGVGYKTPVPVFTDITDHWAANNILFVVSRGLFSDTGGNQFRPNTGMTRGMFVTALGRLAGIDSDNYKIGGKFTDVKADAYYAPYVNWAAEKGIVNGITTTAFSPDGNITREQMAVIMINYAKQMGYDLPVTQEAMIFADNKQISSWAAAEVKALLQAGILAGKDGNRFDPQGNATRAEAATVLRRFVEIVIDSQTAQGWMQNHSGSWQYRRNGKAVTGWLYNNKKWYWLDEKGWMFHGGWKQIDGKYYYFYSDGSMAANTIIDGRKIGSDGAEY